MAITYYALTSTDANNCVLDDAALVKVRARIRLWSRGAGNLGYRVKDGDTPSDKWVVVGDDFLQSDHAGFRTISTAYRDAAIAALNTIFDDARESIANYGRAHRRVCHLDVAVPASVVSAI